MRDIITVLGRFFRLGRSEYILWLIVFAWLMLSGLLVDPDALLAADDASSSLPKLLAFFILEGFITACVYNALKDLVAAGAWKGREFVTGGAYFFGRLMLYKITVAFSGILLVSVALGIIESVKTLSPVISAAVYASALAWIGVPMFFLALTLYAPLIILADDAPLFPAMQKSFRFVREHLPVLVQMVFIFGVLWAVANFGDRLYNIPERFVLVEKSGKAIALSYLEIVTIKAFLSFYITERKSP